MTSASARDALEAAYRAEARRVLATLIRLLGGFEPAEEALHEAFAAAAEQWPREGVPPNPYGWLVSTGRFRAISRWRRQARVNGSLPQLLALGDLYVEQATPALIQDDELRLIFTCCHPALPPDARIALTLREVGGLTTEEIARAYLVPTPTIAQRIVRAKAKIRDEALPYEVPTRADLPARLESALAVIYLIFNEGYAATEGPSLTRSALSDEAIRLARLLNALLGEPDENLTFVDGSAKGIAEGDNNGGGGGAIYAQGGSLKVVNCRFFNNVCDDLGSDVGGGAIRKLDYLVAEGAGPKRPAWVVNSTFGGKPGLGNACANGGALSSIGVSWNILNSVLSENNAVGHGQNDGDGGNGGAIYNDGNEIVLNITGSLLENNKANEGGSAVFFVSNNESGTITLTDSTARNNPRGTFETPELPGFFVKAKQPAIVVNSQILR